jgi:hypothetical protein
MIRLGAGGIWLRRASEQAASTAMADTVVAVTLNVGLWRPDFTLSLIMG